MKRSVGLATACCAAILMLIAATAGTASAHGGVRFGFTFGYPGWYPAPYYSPYYYPPPAYYYPPPVVVAPAAPPVYVEQGRAPAAPSEQYWYFCPDSKAYYPYVQNCASAWQRVAPRPPG
jgi:hypothetical protein